MALTSRRIAFRPGFGPAAAAAAAPAGASPAAVAAVASPGSCRIRMVAFALAALPAWSLEVADDPLLPAAVAGVMALPAEVAEALEDGQLDLFR